MTVHNSPRTILADNMWGRSPNLTTDPREIFAQKAMLNNTLDALLAGLLAEMPEKQDIEGKYEFDGETDFDTTRVEEVKVLVEMSEDNGWNMCRAACIEAITRYFAPPEKKGGSDG